MKTFANLKDGLMKSISAIQDWFFEILPSIIGLIILIVVGLFIAKTVKKASEKLLIKIKIDTLSEKYGLAEMLGKVKPNLKLSGLFSKLLYWIIVLVIIIILSETLGWTMISTGISEIIAYLPQLFIAIFILVIGVVFAKFLKKIVQTATSSIGLSGGGVIANIVYYVIVIFVSITSLNQAGIDTSLITTNIILILAAVLLAFSLAYAFAAKDILTNILSSFYGKGRFKEGQIIKINGQKGKIIKMDSISVTLQLEDKQVVIPGRKLISEEIEIFEN